MTVLRPRYTDYIVRNLEKNSLNIYGHHGQGQLRLRLLTDVEHLLQAKGAWVLFANMKKYAQNYSGFIHQLAIQIEAIIPEILAESLTNFADICEVLEANKQTHQNFIFLDHFDAILDTPKMDKGYDIDFFNTLNALKNQGHRLICITTKKHNLSLIYMDNEIYDTSWLDLKAISLPPLTRKEIKDELLRQKYNPHHKDFDFLVNTIKAHPHSYAFLEYISLHFKLTDDRRLNLKKQLKQLQKAFDQQNSSASVLSLKKLHKGRVWLDKLARVIRAPTLLSAVFKFVLSLFGK